MPLKLEYKDKYRLWDRLVRGNTDRLFVPTDEALRLGDSVPLEIHIEGTELPLVTRVDIIGLRQQSRRFDRGAYVRVPDHELDKCRKFLALQPAPEGATAGRRTPRVHCEFPVRFVTPRVEQAYTTKNLSETGLFVTCPPSVQSGQQVSLYLVLDESPILLQADVAWASSAQGVAGLHITQINDLGAKHLREAVDKLRSEAHRARTPQPILVADDDEAILTFLGKALSEQSYEVFKAHNGDEAFAMVRELQPALVVLDILMPGTDGAEICKAMRADAELAEIKVIFVSALEPDVLHDVADEAGATDYLAKPLRIPALIEMVSHYLA